MGTKHAKIIHFHCTCHTLMYYLNGSIQLCCDGEEKYPLLWEQVLCMILQCAVWSSAGIPHWPRYHARDRLGPENYTVPSVMDEGHGPTRTH